MAHTAQVDRRHPAMRAASRAYQRGFGTAPAWIGSGGTIPVVSMLQQWRSIPTILMGFSLPVDTPGLADGVRRESEVFAEAVAMTADAIGFDLDRIDFDAVFAVASDDSDLGFMTIPRDTVAAVQGYHRGWVGERNVISVGFQWTMGYHVDPPFRLAHGHVIKIDGRPGARIKVQVQPGSDWDEPGYMGLGMIYTAMPAVNAVPLVVAAQPGIVTLKDLPLITGRFAG